MPTEFRQIPDAPLYQMDKEGNIEKIDNGSPIFPFPLKSNDVKLIVNGERKPFLVDQLLKKVWGSSETIVGNISQNPTITKEELKEAHPTPNISEVASTQQKYGNQIESSDAIMKLNCKMSIKIWKLYELGLKEEEIKKIVKHPYSVSVSATIERYKKNEALRDRANSIKE